MFDKKPTGPIQTNPPHLLILVFGVCFMVGMCGRRQYTSDNDDGCL